MNSLCLITSNIRFNNPSDGANAWDHRKSFLSQTLLSHQPDIIATQEGRFDQLLEFSGLLPDYEIVDYHRSWIKERMYPTFFIRKSSFEIVKSDDFWLSDTPDIAGSLSFGSTFPRLVTWIKFQIKNSDRNFFIVNTHLDHVSSTTRSAQINVLIEKVKGLKNNIEHLVIMGDFNDSPIGEVRNILTNNFPHLVDSWSRFNSFEETSHHAFNGEHPNGSRIDWILVDERLDLKNCFLDKSHLNGRYPSDHFPVICRIGL